LENLIDLAKFLHYILMYLCSSVAKYGGKTAKNLSSPKVWKSQAMISRCPLLSVAYRRFAQRVQGMGRKAAKLLSICEDPPAIILGSWAWRNDFKRRC
jgi:hypothetical protein